MEEFKDFCKVVWKHELTDAEVKEIESIGIEEFKKSYYLQEKMLKQYIR